MQKDKLLIEEFWAPSDVSEVTDEATGEKRMRIIGQVQEADLVNRNHRFYPKDVLDDSLIEMNSRIVEGRVLGQADHPDGGIFGGGGPKLKETSHMVKRVWWHEHAGKPTNRLMAEMLVFNTPSGQIIKELVNGGARPGFSSRGHGKSTPIKMRGYEKEVERIEKGFILDSFDFVVDPSVPRARISKIIEQVTGEYISEEKEASMTLQELKAQHLELVTELSEELKKKLQEDAVKPPDPAQATTPAPAKPAAEEPPPGEQVEVDKELTELKTRIEQLEEQCLVLTEETDLHLETVAGILKVLNDGGYVELGATEAEKDTEKESLAAEVATLSEAKTTGETSLTEARTKLTEAQTRITALESETVKAKLEVKVYEMTSNKKFGALLRKKLLAECKTIEEVETKMKDEESLIKAVTSDEAGVLNGKGRSEVVPEIPEATVDEQAVMAEARSAAGMKSTAKIPVPGPQKK